MLNCFLGRPPVLPMRMDQAVSPPQDGSGYSPSHCILGFFQVVLELAETKAESMVWRCCIIGLHIAKENLHGI